MGRGLGWREEKVLGKWEIVVMIFCVLWFCSKGMLVCEFICVCVFCDVMGRFCFGYVGFVWVLLGFVFLVVLCLVSWR